VTATPSERFRPARAWRDFGKIAIEMAFERLKSVPPPIASRYQYWK
jgi:hypothetical protein